MVNTLNRIFVYISFLALFTIFSFNISNAQILDTDTVTGINKQAQEFQKKSGFSETTSVADVLSMVIKAFLGLLGIIFVILIILGGYNWMTAAGEEEKVNKAKDTLKRAIIGLIIVVSAYAITYFVFTNLDGVGGSGMGPG